MAGYKECVSCGRRFFSTDDADYCSPACFSHTSTAVERKKRPKLFYASGICIFLFLFFLVESYAINYVFLVNVPFLRNHAKRVFAEAEFGGVFYLHEELKAAEGDDEVCGLIIDALSGCTFLRNYQWKKTLVKEVLPFRKSDSPQTRRAVVRIIEQVGELPFKIDFFNELLDIETRDAVFSMMEEVKDPSFIGTLKRWLSYGDPALRGEDSRIDAPFVAPEDGDWERIVEITSLIADPKMRNALMLAWIAVSSPSPEARISAVKSIPSLSWRSSSHAFRDEASRNASRAINAIKGIAATSTDIELKEVARKTIGAKHQGIKSGVKFDALSFFE